MNHTSTPWTSCGLEIREGKTSLLLTTMHNHLPINNVPQIENAKFIVKAVNNHERLMQENNRLFNVLDQVICFLERNQEHIPESQDAEEIYFLIQDTIDESEVEK